MRGDSTRVGLEVAPDYRHNRFTMKWTMSGVNVAILTGILGKLWSRASRELQ